MVKCQHDSRLTNYNSLCLEKYISYLKAFIRKLYECTAYFLDFKTHAKNCLSHLFHIDYLSVIGLI